MNLIADKWLSGVACRLFVSINLTKLPNMFKKNGQIYETNNLCSYIFPTASTTKTTEESLIRQRKFLIGRKGGNFGCYGYSTNGYTIYDETILEKTIGLDRNTFVFKETI